MKCLGVELQVYALLISSAIVSPIKAIRYLDQDITVPLDPKNPKAQAGPLTARLAKTIMDIQYGIVPHKWSVEVNEEELI